MRINAGSITRTVSGITTLKRHPSWGEHKVSVSLSKEAIVQAPKIKPPRATVWPLRGRKEERAWQDTMTCGINCKARHVEELRL